MFSYSSIYDYRIASINPHNQCFCRRAVFSILLAANDRGLKILCNVYLFHCCPEFATQDFLVVYKSVVSEDSWGIMECLNIIAAYVLRYEHVAGFGAHLYQTTPKLDARLKVK